MFSTINLKHFIFLMSFILCTSVFAQSDFEGKVVMRISGDQTTDIDYFICNFLTF